MQTDINDTLLFSWKRFIPASNERVHNVFSYLRFFRRARLTTLDSRIDCHTESSGKQASRHVTPNFLGDWVIACFDSWIKIYPKVEKLCTDYESFYGDYRGLFALFVKNVCRWNFFYVDLRFPLTSGHCAGSGWERIHNCYSTMSDGIVDRIFPHSSLNLSVELF